MRIFSHWNGDNGLKMFIREQTGCNPFTGKGICYRKNNNTTILRSVENTFYYDDDLSDENYVKYTLFGQVGDQSEYESTCNEPFLNEEKTHHIYLYSKITDNRYIWYGKYKIVGKSEKQHIDINHNVRKIILIHLKKIEEENNRVIPKVEDTKIVCGCGSTISNKKHSITRHNMSKKHQKWLQ